MPDIEPRVVFLELYNTSRCEHAMVRVRPDMVVPDRCQLHQPYSKGLTTCTGRNGVLKEDLENLKDVLIRIKDDRQEGFHSEANLPAMFLVCKESFEIVSKRYTQAFPLIGASAKTWFDYERDILFFDWGDGFSAATDDAYKIQNICFGLAPGSDPIDRDIRATDIAEILEVFCNVKRLTILVEQYQDFEDPD